MDGVAGFESIEKSWAEDSRRTGFRLCSNAPTLDLLGEPPLLLIKS